MEFLGFMMVGSFVTDLLEHILIKKDRLIDQEAWKEKHPREKLREIRANREIRREMVGQSILDMAHLRGRALHDFVRW